MPRGFKLLLKFPRCRLIGGFDSFESGDHCVFVELELANHFAVPKYGNRSCMSGSGDLRNREPIHGHLSLSFEKSDPLGVDILLKNPFKLFESHSFSLLFIVFVFADEELNL